jgi:hypothetical protein
VSARSTLDDRQVVTVWLSVDQGPIGDEPPLIVGSFVHYPKALAPSSIECEADGEVEPTGRSTCPESHATSRPIWRGAQSWFCCAFGW